MFLDRVVATTQSEQPPFKRGQTVQTKIEDLKNQTNKNNKTTPNPRLGHYLWICLGRL